MYGPSRAAIHAGVDVTRDRLAESVRQVLLNMARQNEKKKKKNEKDENEKKKNENENENDRLVPLIVCFDYSPVVQVPSWRRGWILWQSSSSVCSTGWHGAPVEEESEMDTLSASVWCLRQSSLKYENLRQSSWKLAAGFSFWERVTHCVCLPFPVCLVSHSLLCWPLTALNAVKVSKWCM